MVEEKKHIYLLNTLICLSFVIGAVFLLINAIISFVMGFIVPAFILLIDNPLTKRNMIREEREKYLSQYKGGKCDIL